MKKGDKFTSRYIVDQTIYDGFISLFKDNNALHTDKSFAQQKGFAGRVMHGNILNGFLSYFIGECLPTKNVIIYSQEIKFLRPVYLNDKLNLYCEVYDIHKSVNSIELKYYFENQSNIKIARGKIQIGILQ